MPTDRDLRMATIFGMRAVDLIAEGRFDRMVTWSGRTVIDIPIAEAIARYKALHLAGPLAPTARGLGIYLGELPQCPPRGPRRRPSRLPAGNSPPAPMPGYASASPPCPLREPINTHYIS